MPKPHVHAKPPQNRDHFGALISVCDHLADMPGPTLIRPSPVTRPTRFTLALSLSIHRQIAPAMSTLCKGRHDGACPVLKQQTVVI